MNTIQGSEMKTEKKLFIEKIYLQNWEFSNISQALNASYQLDTLSSKIYPGPRRFLMEILQNCDDASLNERRCEITVHILPEGILISHNGKAMDEKDVEALCSSGRSTKKDDLKYTGYKGLGFKSVFYHSNLVLVISNGYQFRFDQNYFTAEKCWQREWGVRETGLNLKKPWQSIPIWTDDKEIKNCNTDILHLSKDFQVNIFICLNKKKLEQCKKIIFEIEQDNMYLIFLRSKEVRFKVIDGQNIKEFQRKLIDSEKAITAIMSGKNQIAHFYIKTYELDLNDLPKEKLLAIMNDQDISEKSKMSNQMKISLCVKLTKEIESNNSYNCIYKLSALEEQQRLLYSFLPIDKNYNFPFLINADFILDAGRTQIIENLWNTIIFENLPKFIENFIFKKCFKDFGNSYAEILYDPNTLRFESNIFKKAYFDSIKINQNLIKVKTSSGERKLINKCYYNNFNLGMLPDIETFFEKIYFSNTIKILEEYFDNYSFELDNSCEIHQSDKMYVDKIANFYDLKYYSIENEEVVRFLNSNVYQKYYDEKICYNILKTMYEFDKVEFLMGCKFIRDNESCFRAPENLLILEDEDNRFILKNVKDKHEVHDSLKKIVLKMEGNLNLFRTYNIDIINEDCNFDYFINNLEKIYKKETSQKIIRIIIRKWCENSQDENLKLIEKIENLYYLTEDGGFHHPYSINIGTFYYPETKIDYPSYSISRKYYTGEFPKEKIVEFFQNLKMIYNQEILKRKMNLEILKDSPYFSENYLQYFSDLRPDDIFEISVYPTLVSLFSLNDIKIKEEYFKKHFTISKVKIKRRIVKKIPNFLLHYVVNEKRLIYTTKGNLVNKDRTYSLYILNEQTNFLIDEKEKDNIKDLLKMIINIPDEKVYEFLKEQYDDLNNFLSEFDTILLMKEISEKRSSRNEHVFKKYYIFLLLTTINSNDLQYKYSNFNGLPLLDTDFNFCKVNKLYFVQNKDQLGLNIIRTKEKLGFLNLLKPKFSKYIHKKIKKEDNEIMLNMYLNFCEKMGVKIYNPKNFKFSVSTSKEETSIITHLQSVSFAKYLSRIVFIKESGVKKISDIENNICKILESMKFMACDDIVAEISYAEKLNVISIFVNNFGKYTIYFQMNDVYKSWQHKTIAYYLAENIATCLELENFKSEIIFMLESNKNEIQKMFD
jgi:hypothetical protein